MNILESTLWNKNLIWQIFDIKKANKEMANKELIKYQRTRIDLAYWL